MVAVRLTRYLSHGVHQLLVLGLVAEEDAGLGGRVVDGLRRGVVLLLLLLLLALLQVHLLLLPLLLHEVLLLVAVAALERVVLRGQVLLGLQVGALVDQSL